MKTFKIIPIIILVLITVVFAIKIYKYDGKTEIESVLIGKKFPDLILDKLNIENSENRDHVIGKEPLLVNFFASWCLPCRAEHKVLKRISLEKTLFLYGISYKDNIEDTNKFLSNLGNPYGQVGLDLDGEVAIELGVYGVPETFLIDSKGIIKYRHVGALTYEVYREKMIPLLE